MENKKLPKFIEDKLEDIKDECWKHDILLSDKVMKYRRVVREVRHLGYEAHPHYLISEVYFNRMIGFGRAK